MTECDDLFVLTFSFKKGKTKTKTKKLTSKIRQIETRFVDINGFCWPFQFRPLPGRPNPQRKP